MSVTTRVYSLFAQRMEQDRRHAVAAPDALQRIEAIHGLALALTRADGGLEQRLEAICVECLDWLAHLEQQKPRVFACTSEDIDG